MSRKIHDSFVDIAQGVSVKLSDAILATGPVRLTKRNDSPLAVTLCRAVAGQQLSKRAAETIWNRIVESAGGRPLVQYIADAEPDVLRGCGLSSAKTKAMKAIAAASNHDLLNVSRLRRMDHDQRSQQLTSIWGVGQWTADMMGIFYFGDQDVWPESDLTVWKTLERLSSKRRKTSRTAELFAPHRSYLALYMYRIADAD